MTIIKKDLGGFRNWVRNTNTWLYIEFVTFLGSCQTFPVIAVCLVYIDSIRICRKNDIRIKDTRVGIETVLYDFIHQSQSPEAIAARYPSLTLEQVYATITYYLHNKEAVTRYLADWIEHGERMRDEQQQNPPPVVRKLRRLAAEKRSAEA